MKPVFKKEKTPTEAPQFPVTSASQPYDSFFRITSSTLSAERELYAQMRAAIPVIDAAIGKIIRLVGGFKLECTDKRFQELLNDFTDSVPVNLAGISLGSFLESYLDSLLTYGKAVGEILVDENSGEIIGLSNASPKNFHVRAGKSPVERQYFINDEKSERIISCPERILFTALNPTPDEPEGVSILRGVPKLGEILLKIYSCIGKNFDRVGNVRYAVTYKPSSENDAAFSKERAMVIAKEWSDGMHSAKHGVVKDFVAVGDIDIKVIGADNQLIDTEIPARQLIEQILSKLSIPPFLLGLNWTSTERMSVQQVDILTSELEYYRRLLNPVIRQIAAMFLMSHGCDASERIEILWDNINLQDSSELAKARLYNAQSEALEIENRQKKEGE